MELTKPGVCAVAGDAGMNATAETSNATDKLKIMNFLIMTNLTKT